MNIQVDRVKTILIVRNYGLGNFICALPLIESCKSAFPEASISLLVDRRCRSIAELTAGDLPIHIIDDSVDQWLEANPQDIAFTTYPNADADLAFSIARNSNISLGHRLPSIPTPYSLPLEGNDDRHEIQMNLDLLRALDIAPTCQTPSISIRETAAKNVRKTLQGYGISSPFVAFHPGCHEDLDIKRWMPERFASLMRLCRESGRDVVLLGGSEESYLSAQIARQARCGVVDLSGKTDLETCAAILSEASALFSNDSGLMHLGAAVGTSVVGIFGPTSSKKNFPLGNQNIALSSNLPCSPCYRPGTSLSPCRRWCLDKITTQRAWRALSSIFDGTEFFEEQSQQKTITVIVPTRNGAGRIETCLKALQNQTYPKHLTQMIVVNNGSTDKTAEVVKRFTDVTCISFTEKAGSYAARNAGIKSATGEILAFTDDDCVPGPDWLTMGVAWFAHDSIGCVAGNIHGYEPDSDIARFQTRHRHLSPTPEVETRDDLCVPTANAFYRKAVFDKLGLFHDEMISGGDLEMSRRLRRDGRWKIKHCPQAQVEHRHRERLLDFSRVFFRYGYGHVLQDKYTPDKNSDTGDRLAKLPATWLPLVKQGLAIARSKLRSQKGSSIPMYSLDTWLEKRRHRNPVVFYAGHPPESKFTFAGYPLSLPPEFDYLNEALKAVAEKNRDGLFLYGAGRHTRRLMTMPGFSQVRLRGIIDDSSSGKMRMGGLPVVSLKASLSMGLQAILISTDAYENQLLRKLAPLASGGIEVMGFYDAEALRRYGGHCRLEVPQSPVALFVGPDQLTQELREGLALGLGAEVVCGDFPPEKYSDEFLDWVMRVAQSSGRLAGSIRYWHLYP